MVIFHSYVKLPEGTICDFWTHLNWGLAIVEFLTQVMHIRLCLFGSKGGAWKAFGSAGTFVDGADLPILSWLKDSKLKFQEAKGPGNLSQSLPRIHSENSGFRPQLCCLSSWTPAKEGVKLEISRANRHLHMHAYYIQNYMILSNSYNHIHMHRYVYIYIYAV